ncbi:MAG: ribosome biogenesis GTP-binding protein YihA/YsxC [Clostridia bacterium]|nr:ribosome biogenesis GTP-binding protein YihA/YsxC [Clostridia bacterium]
MIIKKAKFLLSQSKFGGFPQQGMPEIAMAGKSNVGKSSLINSLTRHSKLARTSSEPGKTRLINYYSINEEFLLVDLPGYGFARAPKSEQEKWSQMIEGYLTGSQQLKHVFHLVDIRHAPTKEDQMMTEYLRHYDIPFTVIATKADKLSKAQRSRSIPVICRTLVVQPWEIMTYSSEDLTGRDALLDKIDEILGLKDETTEGGE